MIICIRRFHKIATEKVVDSRKPRCIRMSPRSALNRGETQSCKSYSHWIHADFRIYQDMKIIFSYGLTQFFKGIYVLNEASKGLPGIFSRFILSLPGVIAIKAESLLIYVFDPTFNWNFPIGMQTKRNQKRNLLAVVLQMNVTA